MKLKKYSYLLVLMLTLIIGIKGVYAESKKTCYYQSSDADFKATVTFRYGYKNPNNHVLEKYSKVYIDKTGKTYLHNGEMILNWITSARQNTPKNSDIKFDDYYANSRQANSKEPTCPTYLVLQECSTFKVWATESQSLAQKAIQDINTSNNCTGYYGSKYAEDGTELVADEYYSEFVSEGLVHLDEVGMPTCNDLNDMLGDKNDDGVANDPDRDGNPSIRYMLDTALQYVRIIVPILIIVLGTFDFAKAVMAGKEDNMRKAQLDFVKRLLIGVAIFFVPLLVDIVMYLAEIMWPAEYLICDF